MMHSLNQWGIVKRLCEDRCLQDALHFVRSLDQPAASDIFFELINWSIRYKDLSAGRNILRLVIESGLEADPFLGNNLIRMFGLCSGLPEVNQVFSKLCEPSALTWSVTIAAFANLGHIDTALLLCDTVKLFDHNATDYLLTTMLKACSNVCALQQGKIVHDFAVRAGLESMTVVVNSLIDMYFKCGTEVDARKVFDKVTRRDVVTWTATLAGYVQLKDGAEALQIFQQMGSSGIEPNRVTYTGVLRACACLGSPLEGRLIHAEVIEQGFDHVSVVVNSLIDMYTKCKSLQDGLEVFECLTNKNIVSWTAILEAYIQNAKDGSKVTTVFEQMLREGWKPDNVLVLNLLKACNEVLSFGDLRLLHSYAVEDSLDVDKSVNTGLVNMYMNHGSMKDAFKLYNSLFERSLVMYTAMISGLVEGGRNEEALELFWMLQNDALDPDFVCFISILKACSNTAANIDGRVIHAQIIEAGLGDGAKIGTALVDFYSKSGSLMDARKVLDTSAHADVVGWTAMIAGYVEGREYTLALQCFKDMQKKGIQPDNVACICVLSAYTHMGSVDEGCHFFMLMRDVYGITPGLGHYDCMANLLGHAGYVTTAGSLLHTLPHLDDSTTWISLLGRCTSYGDSKFGAQCFDQSS
ncbi:hypothetical protein L7F22_024492 [Adiantum nelumboides]|nr:hypothetical protein [Adiantum nelumboides]